jgi:hypothetical protein
VQKITCQVLNSEILAQWAKKFQSAHRIGRAQKKFNFHDRSVSESEYKFIELPQKNSCHKKILFLFAGIFCGKFVMEIILPLIFLPSFLFLIHA